MNKQFFSLLAICFLFVLSIVTVSGASYMQQRVEFGKENFAEGITLYSEPIHIYFGKIWGRDVYPDDSRNINVREKVCTTEIKKKRVRECRTNTDGFRERKVKRCYTRGNQYPTVCETIIKKIPIKSKRICEWKTIDVPKEKCKFVTSNPSPILCINPDGTASNVLKLENFEMSFDNLTWQDIPYINDKLRIEDETVYFRVNIPEQCSPTYRIDKAITYLS